MGNKLSSAGFTLLETLIAMAIMFLAFSAIFMIESSSINALDKTKRMNVVAMLAKRTMAETEQKMEGKAFADLAKEEGKQFDEPFQDYRWKREIKEVKFPNLGAVGGGAGSGAQPAAGEDAAGSNDRMTEILGRLITKFLSDSIREVVVTVTWKRGNKDQDFKITTYWVDLNHEFALTE